MTRFIWLAVAIFVASIPAQARHLTAHHLHKTSPVLPLGLWKQLKQLEVIASTASLTDKYPARTLQVPVDHFDDSSNTTFGLRYWVDASHYKPGGPVFCLESGETDAEDRLPFLDHGILKLLSQATNGLSIVLEHRYYGQSWPVPDLSTDNMRFLTTAQALADNTYFTKHVKVAGLSKEQTEAIKTAKWIYYGGRFVDSCFHNLYCFQLTSTFATHLQLSWRKSCLPKEAVSRSCSWSYRL
jgi:hypothetical protein